MPIRSRTYPYTEEAIKRHAPQQHGVYAIVDAGGIVYYGRAAGKNVTIRGRLHAHKRGVEGPCTQLGEYFLFEVTSAPIKREKQLLQEYQEQFGHLPDCNDRAP